MSRRGKKGYRQVIIQSIIAMPTLTVLLSFVCAKLIIGGTVSEGGVDVCAFVIAGVTSFLVSLYVSVRMPQKKALWGFATACAYATMLLLGNLLFFGVEYGAVVPVILTVLGVGVAGSLIGSVKRRKYA